MPGRALIADHTPTGVVVQQAMAAAGMAAVIVTDGDHALSHSLSGRYELLLFDAGLPRRDGITLVRQLRGAGVITPIILLGGPADASEIAAGLDAGADDYLTWPLRLDELVARGRRRVLRVRSVSRPVHVTRTGVPTDGDFGERLILVPARRSR